MLKEYNCSEVHGDRYSAQWVVTAFAAHGITYRASERDRSQIFLEFLPMATRGQVELLDNKVLLAELKGLERKTRPMGRDQATHGPAGHDDVANAAAGACVLCGCRSEPGMLTWIRNLAQGARTADEGKAHEHRVHTAAGTQVGYTKVIHRNPGPPQGLTPAELAEWIRKNR